MNHDLFNQSQFRRSLILFFAALSIGYLTSFAPSASAADEFESMACPLEAPLPSVQTLPTLLAKVVAQEKAIEKAAPLPEFVSLRDEIKQTWPGIEGPRALAGLLPEGASFLASKAPGAELQGFAKLAAHSRSLPLRYEFSFDGRRTHTTLYVSLPKNKPVREGQNKYLIDSTYKHMVFHIHGGGTPTASGANAMSIGEYLSDKGIPVLAPDMPGHGRSDRNPVGSAIELLDWCMKMIDNTVHPDVEVTLSGHSWGGEFAATLHLLSRLPTYKRIRKIISLSPPVDVTLSGTNREKANFDQWFEKNFSEFKDQIAEGDYEFLENLVANAKISPVADWFTVLTALLSKSKPLTAEDQEGLAPMLVIVGTADGLVYVGREKEFDQVFGSLIAPSKYVKMGPGLTFKSKSATDLVPTGHNIFDRYIDGTFVAKGSKGVNETYDRIFRFVVGEDQVANWAGEEDSDRQSAEGVLSDLLFSYANNFLAREFLSSHVETIITPTEHFEPLQAEFSALEKLKKRIAEIKRQASVENKKLWRERQAEFASSLGLSDRMNPERAQWEIDLPDSSPERAAELNAFTTSYLEAQKKVIAEWVDPHQEAKDQLLASIDVGDNEDLKDFKEIKTIDDVKTLQNEVQALKGRRSKEKKQLTQSEKDLQKSIGQIMQEYATLEQQSNALRDEAIAASTASLQLPDGARSPKAVKQELDLIENQGLQIGPQRRAVLGQFLEGLEKLENDFKEEREIELAQTIAALPDWDDKIPDETALLERLEKVSGILNYTYVPTEDRVKSNQGPWDRFTSFFKSVFKVNPPPGSSRLASIVQQLETIHERFQILKQGPESAAAASSRRVKLLKKRDTIYRQLRQIWTSDEMTSPEIEVAQSLRAKALDEFIAAVDALSLAQRRYLEKLQSENQLSAENITNYPAEIDELGAAFKLAKTKYLESLEEERRAIFVSSYLGTTRHPESEQMVKLMHELLGPNYLNTKKAGEGSLNAQIAEATAEAHSKQREALDLQNQETFLKAQYLKALQEEGVPAPFSVSRVEIKRLLEMNASALYQALKDNHVLMTAMHNTQSQWDRILKPYLEEQQYIDLNPFESESDGNGGMTP